MAAWSLSDEESHALGRLRFGKMDAVGRETGPQFVKRRQFAVSSTSGGPGRIRIAALVADRLPLRGRRIGQLVCSKPSSFTVRRAHSSPR